VRGNAIIRDAEGNVRTANAGDRLASGETLLTSSGSQVQLTMADGQALVIGADQALAFGPEMIDGTAAASLGEDAELPTAAAGAVESDIEAVITALETGEDLTEVLAPAAAGPGGGGAGQEGHGFVRLLRISEELNPVEYAFRPETPRDTPTFEGGLVTPEEP